jgi:ankyrin repeat protein
MKHSARIKGLFILFAVSILLLAACGKETPTPTPTVEPESEVAPQPAVTEEVEAESLDQELVEAVESGDAAETERLLDLGADPMAPTPIGPLPSLAAMKGDPKILGLLGQHGADFNLPALDGQTPIQIAAGSGNTEAVGQLLDLGIDPNIMGGEGTAGTPLMSAIEGGQFETVELLLDRGADPNLANPEGMTPLLTAVEMGNVEIAELLIGSEAILDLPNMDGNTPLHLAALNEDLEMFQLLLESGADFSILNEAGQLPIDLGESDFSEMFSDLGLDLEGLIPSTGD